MHRIHGDLLTRASTERELKQLQQLLTRKERQAESLGERLYDAEAERDELLAEVTQLRAALDDLDARAHEDARAAEEEAARLRTALVETEDDFMAELSQLRALVSSSAAASDDELAATRAEADVLRSQLDAARSQRDGFAARLGLPPGSPAAAAALGGGGAEAAPGGAAFSAVEARAAADAAALAVQGALGPELRAAESQAARVMRRCERLLRAAAAEAEVSVEALARELGEVDGALGHARADAHAARDAARTAVARAASSPQAVALKEMAAAQRLLARDRQLLASELESARAQLARAHSAPASPSARRRGRAHVRAEGSPPSPGSPRGSPQPSPSPTAASAAEAAALAAAAAAERAAASVEGGGAAREAEGWDAAAVFASPERRQWQREVYELQKQMRRRSMAERGVRAAERERSASPPQSERSPSPLAAAFHAEAMAVAREAAEAARGGGGARRRLDSASSSPERSGRGGVGLSPPPSSARHGGADDELRARVGRADFDRARRSMAAGSGASSPSARRGASGSPGAQRAGAARAVDPRLDRTLPPSLRPSPTTRAPDWANVRSGRPQHSHTRGPS